MEHDSIMLAQPYATTRDGYDACAGSYDAWCRAYEPYRVLWDGFLDLLPDRPRISDLGCGSGVFLERALIRRPSAEVEGFDFSSRMLAIAKTSIPSAKWNLADIRSVALPARSFDAVVLSGCLSHLFARDATKLLLESVFALRDGGLLYASVLESDAMRVEQGSFEHATFGGDLPFFCVRIGIQDIVAALRGAGLELLALERVGASDTAVPPWRAPETVIYARRK